MWIANLSNGKIVSEKESLPGDISAWQKLLKRCRNGGLKITGLRLTDNQRMIVSAVPHQLFDGYFQAYEVSRDMFSGNERKKQGIGSVIGDSVFITWIEPANNDLTYVWTEVRDLKSSLIHTTLS